MGGIPEARRHYSLYVDSPVAQMMLWMLRELDAEGESLAAAHVDHALQIYVANKGYDNNGRK